MYVLREEGTRPPARTAQSATPPGIKIVKMGSTAMLNLP
jgi:hypothetical protein